MRDSINRLRRSFATMSNVQSDSNMPSWVKQSTSASLPLRHVQSGCDRPVPARARRAVPVWRYSLICLFVKHVKLASGTALTQFGDHPGTAVMISVLKQAPTSTIPASEDWGLFPDMSFTKSGQMATQSTIGHETPINCPEGKRGTVCTLSSCSIEKRQACHMRCKEPKVVALLSFCRFYSNRCLDKLRPNAPFPRK